VSSIKWFETKWRSRLTEYLANQLVKCIRVDLTDSAAPYMDMDLLGARQLCRLLRGTAYGIREGRVMLDRRDRNPSKRGRISKPVYREPARGDFHLTGAFQRRGARPTPRLAAPAWFGGRYALDCEAWRQRRGAQSPRHLGGGQCAG